MLAHLQAHIENIIARNRAERAVIRATDFGFTAPCPEPDPELDALLDTLDAVAAANDDEIGLVGAPAEVPDLVTKRVAGPRRRKARTGLRQREDVRDLRARARRPSEEVVEHLHTTPHTPDDPKTTSLPMRCTTPDTSPTKPRARTTITGPGRRGRMIASWEEAGDLPRLIAVNRALADFGRPFAFSVNIAPDLIRAANDNARGALDFLRRRIALTLKRSLGATPPMWLAIETDDDGRPHIHGGLALNDMHSPAAVEAVLAKAGGDWTRQGSAPADVRAQWDPDGWSIYPLKRAARTRQHLREATGLEAGARIALVSWSSDLGRAGRHLHEEERRAIGRR